MKQKVPLKVGIIGTGMIAKVHADAIATAEGMELIGVHGRRPEATDALAAAYGAPSYRSLEVLLECGKPDYIVICTPHPTHGAIAKQALQEKVSVLIEKPFTVLAREAAECIAIAKQEGVLIGVNFQMRLRPIRQKMLQLIREGVVGNVIRISMISTMWFRTMAYYQSSPWRATWEGEGGGVLMNQAPHDLDFLIHLLGLPESVSASMDAAGHAIEVEDDVSGMMKWANGAVGTFHISTREAPGRFFLEIAGSRSTLRLEGEDLELIALNGDSEELSQTSQEFMKAPGVLSRTVWNLADSSNRYRLMHENFRDALRGEAALYCSGEDALREVELANALLVSALCERPVRIPVNPMETQEVYTTLKSGRSLATARAKLASENVNRCSRNA